jgi:hypothetical protein
MHETNVCGFRRLSGKYPIKSDLTTKEVPMNSKLLPIDLQPDRRLHASENAFPIMQTNPITGYQTSLYRSGATADFLGWILLVNGNTAAGYIYIRTPVSSPYLGSTGYVVMDITPELLDPLLRILQSGEPLQIRFYQGAANVDASAFLEHRP